ncbi:deoxycytidine triphosphate deaminase [Streptomyces sp. OF3]|uniref:Deoxycytidine triphosphate deaminase n=1 Tax=Streptomyces alkaliterrae TaxID=2213162 RepID=A0A7W3WJL4_9ACTN|nr:PEP/pyruvate-binding domain-containing protein [Streptomyces alkaliterrae]MBB1253551.1 deoxycytidine triphosphate deaminase [Streptomyces alkaliterrae]
MILTGTEIERERRNGRITIEPFTPEQVNPNSYNFRLGRTLRVYREMPLDARHTNEVEEIEIPDEGYVLEPGRLYLAHTVERLGSEHYAPTFAARSSVARLGLFINLSASLGDIGYTGQWTLQLYSMNRVRVYPGINIGQMMWWRPQGEIVLYDGKYQGSVGPRSSDIHVDFDKQFARQRFPGLGATFEADEVGPKFAGLARASADFRVPAAFCVPAGEFVDALTEEQRNELADAFTDLRATVGAFFADSVARIQKTTAEIRLPRQARVLLAARLAELFKDADGVEFAVRSSGLDEDTGTSSLAGVHQSVLGVRGADAVIDAVESCWRSHYEAPAVAARIRAGDFSPTPRLAVIVQRMVRPTLAGVAFTGLDGPEGTTDPEGTGAAKVVVEYVEGLADELVAGVAVPRRVDSVALAAGPAPEASRDHPVLLEVVDLVRRLREDRGHDVDVEWAADADGVHLVQVRPLTAAREVSTVSAGPVAEGYRLYVDDLPSSFTLGAVAAVYGGYTAKRGPAHRLAHRHGVATGAGWVLRFNGRGLHGERTSNALREMLAGGSDECVLDFGDNLRQIVVPKEDVLDRLAVTSGASPDGTALHSVILRDFVRGQLGVISRRVDGGGLVVEYTEEGLMALNRGTAGGETIIVGDVSDDSADVSFPASGAVLRPHLDEIGRFTEAMHAEYGPVTLEWVHDDGTLYFVDYSVLGGDDAVTVAHGEVCISPGTARGPLLRLDDDALLRRLSIGPAVSIDKSRDVSEHDGLARILEQVASYERKPVVSAARPYAVLSVLLDHVAGFVFDQGSALGHLAILLREARIPAVTAAGISGTEVVISDGTVTTTGSKGA